MAVGEGIYCPFNGQDVDGRSYCWGEACQLWTSHTSYTFNVHEDGSISEDATVTGGCAFRTLAESFTKKVNWEGTK